MQIEILPETMKSPITTIGRNIGLCYDSDTADDEKNYRRGLNSIKAGHGRVLEFAETYMSIKGVSARTMRQFYTHIGGSPTRVQESTRYIDYKDFKAVVPSSIKSKPQALKVYNDTLSSIKKGMDKLQALSVPTEDRAMLLPLGMETGVCCKINMRNLENMYAQRTCNRAYQEYRDLMFNINVALHGYSEEWAELCKLLFKCKCEKTGFCEEEYSCGRKPKVDKD